VRFLGDEVQFNVFKHALVPSHYLLSDEEAKEVLKKLKVDKDQLPKIRRSDPCKFGPIKEGRVVKVVRQSRTSEVATAYRLVRG
jgi:DNA-directed RNA polymerase subunit H